MSGMIFTAGAKLKKCVEEGMALWFQWEHAYATPLWHTNDSFPKDNDHRTARKTEDGLNLLYLRPKLVMWRTTQMRKGNLIKPLNPYHEDLHFSQLSIILAPRLQMLGCVYRLFFFFWGMCSLICVNIGRLAFHCLRNCDLLSGFYSSFPIVAVYSTLLSFQASLPESLSPNYNIVLLNSLYSKGKLKPRKIKWLG